jgi:NAD(P)-dependent dehydrogenase (short-subunit alcohol dehydrogenase family)
MGRTLANKNIIITGAASGIGKAIAMVLAGEGAILHLLDINGDTLNEVVAELRKQGGSCHGYPCDITQQKAVIGTMAAIAERGQINILINNAGVAHIGTVEQTREDDFDRVFNVNVKGSYNCIYAVIPYLKEKGGLILNMVSVAASVGIAERFAYSASKGALLTMTYSVAKDYVDKGIRCNSISPARVHTPFVDGYLRNTYPGEEEAMYKTLERTQPIGRMAQPKEIAHLVRYLCSDEASFITGTDFPIDGGFIKLNS